MAYRTVSSIISYNTDISLSTQASIASLISTGYLFITLLRITVYTLISSLTIFVSIFFQALLWRGWFSLQVYSSSVTTGKWSDPRSRSSLTPHFDIALYAPLVRNTRSIALWNPRFCQVIDPSGSPNSIPYSTSTSSSLSAMV